MVKGNIFLDKEGINVSNIQVPDRNNVLTEFYIMRERARINGDSFFYVNTKEFEDFNEKVWSSDDPYWEGVEQGIIASIQNDFITPILINDITEFDVKPEPRTHGGYGYYEHPVIGYVHNINTWEDWHYKWNLEHTRSAPPPSDPAVAKVTLDFGLIFPGLYGLRVRFTSSSV